MKNLLLITLLLMCNFTIAQKNFIDQNYIEVTGTIESEIIPDKIYLSIAINENDKKGKESVEEQESKMIKALKSMGINTDKKLSIEGFNSTFINYFLRKDDVLKVKQYTLLVHDTQTLANVFKTFDLLEISKVYISKIDHSNIENLKQEAKIKAIKMAKEKAKLFAQGIDQKVGKAIMISENSLRISNATPGSENAIIVRGYSSAIYGSNANSNIDLLDFKKITIVASMEAKFELL